MQIKNQLHIPVMINEVINNFNIKKNGIYVDCTFGNGGHSLSLLNELKCGKLVSFEWDKKTFSLFKDSIQDPNFTLINDNFVNIKDRLKEINVDKVDGFLFDLGISSYQLSEMERGFSYRLDSPLDMRINQDQKLDASYVLNNYSCDALSDIFFNFGEEKKSRIIAKKICYWRKKKPIEKTEQLVGIIASCFEKKKNKHPARKVFQALRIFVNKELENISKSLDDALELLKKGGKIIVISFHSLEDRIVKRKFKEKGNEFRILTKRPLIASDEEISVNNRSRSAKMRIIEKIS